MTVVVVGRGGTHQGRGGETIREGVLQEVILAE
jgi:hypothetical protein